MTSTARYMLGAGAAFGLIGTAVLSALLLGWSYIPTVAPAATPGAADGAHCPPGASDAGGFFDNLFKVYTPRITCMYFEMPTVWLHLVSDLLIAFAYYSIPVALVYFVSRRRDIAFNWVFWMFAGFIMACGTTHFVGAWDLWQPFYRLDGLIKAATALLSVGTAIALWPLIPRALELPSPAELERIIERRTAELAQTNETLRAEIKARRRVEEEREALLVSERAARAEAERVNRIKDEFLAVVSHELRTPLSAILGWSYLLQRTPGLDAEAAGGLRIVERNARAQARLVEDLLDMSRIVAGKLRIEPRQLDLAVVLRAAVEAVAHAADAKQISIETSVAAEARRIWGDPDRLQQVLWNLLSNAVKFTPAGGRVRAEVANGSAGIEIRVTDSGPGIPADFLPHLFQRFQQADASTTRAHRGLGIGLAIARHIVELHGGTIRAENLAAGGARFVVQLPAAPAPIGEPALSSPGEGDIWSESDDALAARTMLVVDDEPEARDLLRRLLEPRGARVLVAGSAAEGLRLVREQEVDVLLCDIGLPGEDGYSLIRSIRALPHPRKACVRALAVTAFAGADDQTRAREAGFDAHLAKPFEPLAVIALVLQLLRR